MKLPYRDPEPAEPDREMPAIAELEARVRRVRTALILGIFAIAVPLSAVGYFAVQELQFAMRGRAFIWLNAALGCGIPFFVAFKAADVVVPRIVARFVDRWLPSIAKRYGVPVEDLAEYTTHLR